MANGNKPARVIRIGYVKGTIWRNKEGDSVFYNTTFTRSYKDNGDWKDGDSFSHADLPVLSKVADQATDWISAQ